MTRTIKYLPVDDLQADPRNPKSHSVETIDASMERFGVVESIVLDDRTGFIISGHGRTKTLKAMQERGAEPPEGIRKEAKTGRWLAPVLTGWASVSDEEAGAALIALNRTTELGGWVDDALLTLLDGLSAVDGGLVGVGYDQGDLDALRASLGGLVDRPSADTADDTDSTPPENPVSVLGDVWTLGVHRLVVGDSTVGSVVDAAVEDTLVDMVWTDPPYGVAIGDKNAMLDSMGRGSSGRVTENLANDTLDEESLRAFLSAALGEAYRVSKRGGVWQVAAPPGPLHLIFGAVLNELGVWRQTIQWVKNNSTFSPLGVHYHWRSEPIFHGWKPGAASQGPPDRTQTTVWEIDRPARSVDHPTMKPVALVEKAILNHTDPGQTVFDPFLGSGTTLLAAEITGRRCVGIELSPRFADVVCRRYQELTGDLTILASTGQPHDFLTTKTLAT